MTTAEPELVFDGVANLAMDLVASRATLAHKDFKRLLAEFAVAVIREAFEHQDEIRARLGMPRPIVTAADVAGGTDATVLPKSPPIEQPADKPNRVDRAGAMGGAQRPFCYAEIMGAIIDHDCTRKRELGFDGGARERPASVAHESEATKADSRADLSTSSTGAAEAERNADIRTGVNQPAASVAPPAAPPISQNCDNAPLAEPAPPQAEGVVGTALSGGDAGASPAGVSAGAEASQPRTRLTEAERLELRRACLAARRSNGGALPDRWMQKQAAALGVPYKTVHNAVHWVAKSELSDTEPRETPARNIPRNIPAVASVSAQASAAPHTPASEPESPGAAIPTVAESRPAATEAAGTPRAPGRAGAPPKISDEQKAQINRDYLAARAANGGQAVRGWVSKRAAELGVSLQTIYRALETTQIALLTDSVASTAAPARPRTSVDEGELAHTETPACWCRRKPANRDNVWCKLRRLEKPVSQHAALRTPEPRVRRMIGTRY
jgi:hypothetical protein